MDTVATACSSGPQNMPEMGDEWGKRMMIQYHMYYKYYNLLPGLCVPQG